MRSFCKTCNVNFELIGKDVYRCKVCKDFFCGNCIKDIETNEKPKVMQFHKKRKCIFVCDDCMKLCK